MVMTAETECGVPMARMPGAEMAAKMATVPIMKMRRPVVPVMAVMHHVVEVVSVMKVVKVAAEKPMTEAAKTAETMRHGVRCRERDSKQTNSGDGQLPTQHRFRLRGKYVAGIIAVRGGKFDRPGAQIPEIVKLKISRFNDITLQVDGSCDWRCASARSIRGRSRP
jgi:hypothetical protein